MVQAHDNHMTGLMRRARHAAEADARQLRQAAEAGLVTLIDTGEAVLAGDREESVAGLRERIGTDRLVGAVMACRAVAANDARGVVDAVIARYPDLRKSLPAFWSLPFVSDTGRDDLLRCTRSGPPPRSRRDQGAAGRCPDRLSFPPAGRKCCATIAAGCGARSGKPHWQWPSATHCAPATFTFPIAVSMPGSGRWCSNERLWASCPHSLLCRSRPVRAAGRTSRAVWRAPSSRPRRPSPMGLAANSFARIDQGATAACAGPMRWPSLPELRSLRRLIESRMPRIRLEDVLLDVDRRCGFTRAFRPLAGYEPRGTDTYRTLLATLIAHGTNLGLTAMGSSVEGLTAPISSMPLAGWCATPL